MESQQTPQDFIPKSAIDPQTRRKKIHCKQELIITSLQRYYSTLPNLSEVVDLLKGTSDVSLRLIDWFVTNYAKQNTISYILNGQEFSVYMNYKNQLKAYSKKLFDPFCRRERILFEIRGHEPFLTTVGKLNFFRWAIEKGILDYIKGHQPEIEKEMNNSMRELAKQRSESTPNSQASDESSTTISTVKTTQSQTRKRVATSGSKESMGINQLQKHNCPIEIIFD